MKVSETTPGYKNTEYYSGNPLIRSHDIPTRRKNKNGDSKGSALNPTRDNNSSSSEESNHAERLHIRHTNVDNPSLVVYNWNCSYIKSSDTYSKDKKGNNNKKDINEDTNRNQTINNNKCSNKQHGNNN